MDLIFGYFNCEMRITKVIDYCLTWCNAKFRKKELPNVNDLLIIRYIVYFEDGDILNRLRLEGIFLGSKIKRQFTYLVHFDTVSSKRFCVNVINVCVYTFQNIIYDIL